jgi:hypothetical protein
MVAGVILMTPQEIIIEIRKLSRAERIQGVQEVVADLGQEPSAFPTQVHLTSPIIASDELIENALKFMVEGEKSRHG